MNGKGYVDVHERPAFSRLIPLSVQHLFAMFGATVLVPIITGLDVSVALLTSGLGTLLFLVLTKGKVPNYLGSSFAFIGPILTVSAQHGKGTALLGCLLAGLVYTVVAAVVARTGVGWLNRLLPPVVIGAVVAVIGLSLAGVAVNWAVHDPANPERYSLAAVEVALVTLAVTLAAMTAFRGFLSLIPVLVGIVGGYAYAALRHPAMIDAHAIAKARWFIYPIAFVQQKLLVGEVLAAMADPAKWLAALVIVPVAFVTLTEHIGHLLVTGKVMERDLMRDPGLHRTLLGDGLATSLAAFLGGPPNTTYGENIGVLAITRVFSRHVIALAAVFAIAFAFCEKLSAVLQQTPKPVLGGVMILLFGIIAVQGLRMFVEHRTDFSDRRTMAIAAVVLVAGIGGFKLELPGLAVDNIAMATFLGMLLAALLPGKRREEARPEAAPAKARVS